MPTQTIGIVMNGVTGRMGTNQHLARSVCAIIAQGGVRAADGTVIMPRPILTGRNADDISGKSGLLERKTSGGNFSRNAMSRKHAAAMVGVDLPPVESVRQVSRANVANLLPLPGGPVLRHRVLASRGAPQRPAARAQLITGIWWLANGLTVSGLALMAVADRWWIGGLGVLGGATFAVIGWTVRPRSALTVQMGSLMAVELVKVVVGATRFWLIALLLGAELGWLGAMSTAFTVPAAAALGIFPSGIGAREALVGGVAELIGASAALLFLAATIERVVATVAMLPVLVWALWGRSRETASQ